VQETSMKTGLKMAAICFSEMSADFKRTTRRCIPEDGTLQDENLSNIGFIK
jgi:hypothetical protein